MEEKTKKEDLSTAHTITVQKKEIMPFLAEFEKIDKGFQKEEDKKEEIHQERIGEDGSLISPDMAHIERKILLSLGFP